MKEHQLVINRLTQTFEDTKFGPSMAEGAWHGPSLIEALEGVDVPQANARTIEGRHTIWEIVKHCTFWMKTVIGTLQGKKMSEIKPTENWPETAEQKMIGQRI